MNKLNIKQLWLVLTISALFGWNCQQNEGPYAHTFDPGSLTIDSIYYLTNDGEQVMGVGLADSNTWVFESVNAGDSFTVKIVAQSGTFQFRDISGKYLNADGAMYFSENTFEPFFPKEWEPLKASASYATMKFEKDQQHFFFITTDYRADRTIGSYFESW